MINLLIALNQMGNDALDQAEADIAAAQEILKAYGGEDVTDDSDTE